MDKCVLIVGATSGIGRAIAEELAMQGHDLALAGRDLEEVDRIAADLAIRHQVAVVGHPFEATDFDSHPALVSQAAGVRGLAGVICSQGYMVAQTEAAHDFAAAQRMIEVNYSATVSVLQAAAAHLKESGGGYLCAISSVAGDRGRQSNFIYGSTKSAVATYLQGLRNSLFASGVHVLTVKPGFVDTPMTWGLLDPKSPMVATPQSVARDIVRAINRKKNVVYTPRFWWIIMAVIRGIPETIFKRLSL